MSKVFRSAALDAQKTKALGDIVLIRPISFAYLAAVSGLIALLVVAFFVWGAYTKRSTVSGQLIPDTGLVKVFVPQPGIVWKTRSRRSASQKKGCVICSVKRASK